MVGKNPKKQRRFQEKTFQKKEMKLDKPPFLLLEKEDRNLSRPESLIYYQL